MKVIFFASIPRKLDWERKIRNDRSRVEGRKQIWTVQACARNAASQSASCERWEHITRGSTITLLPFVLLCSCFISYDDKPFVRVSNPSTLQGKVKNRTYEQVLSLQNAKTRPSGMPQWTWFILDYLTVLFQLLYTAVCPTGARL
jgi:hypothetical protein